MKKFILLCILSFTASLPAHAQVGKEVGEAILKAAVENTARQGTRVGVRNAVFKAASEKGLFSIDKEFLKKAAGGTAYLLDPLYNLRGEDYYKGASYSDWKLNEKRYGKLAHENNNIWVAGYVDFLNKLRYVKANAAQIAKSVEVQALDAQDVSYVRDIPEESRMIFLGEVHNTAPVSFEINEVVKTYQKRFPDRKIIILTEMLSPTDILPHAPGYAKDGLLWSNMCQEASTSTSLRTLVGLFESGFWGEGLEEPAALRSLAKKMGDVQDMQEYKELIVSFMMMKARNGDWAKRITKMRRRYPDAVFFVYGGLAHFRYDLPFNVQSFLPEEKPYVMFFSLAGEFNYDSPFLSYLEPFEDGNVIFAHDFLRKKLVRRLTDARYRSYLSADVMVNFPEDR